MERLGGVVMHQVAAKCLYMTTPHHIGPAGAALKLLTVSRYQDLNDPPNGDEQGRTCSSGAIGAVVDSTTRLVTK